MVLFLALASLVPSLAEPLTVRCDGRGPCSGTLTFTGTVVSTVSLRATASDGVLAVEWSTSGSSDAVSGRRLGFYDERLVAVSLRLGLDGALSSSHLGGVLAWAGPANGGELARR